jgi:hypothetical protein
MTPTPTQGDDEAQKQFWALTEVSQLSNNAKQALTAHIRRAEVAAKLEELEPLLPKMTVEKYSHWVRARIFDRIDQLKGADK